MSHAPTPAQSFVVDIVVTLTAIVRPESEAGGYSASIPALLTSMVGANPRRSDDRSLVTTE